jgi:hypothetical protein
MTKKDILRRRYFNLQSAIHDLLLLKEYSIREKQFWDIFPVLNEEDIFPPNKLQSFFGIDAAWFNDIKKRGRGALPEEPIHNVKLSR